MKKISFRQQIPALLILTTVLLLSGCPFIDWGDCGVNDLRPQSTSEISQVKVSEFTQAPSVMGKIYLYQQYLFINSPYSGIYIYNN